MLSFVKMIGLSSLVFLFFHSSYGAEVVRLSDEAMNNSKTFIVSNTFPKAQRTSFIIKGTYFGEPAGAPVYLSGKVKCPGQKKYVDFDLASLLVGKLPKASLEMYLSASHGPYKNGQIHVCSLEKVNFDEDKLMITFLKADHSGCNPQYAYDFIFPLKEICQ